MCNLKFISDDMMYTYAIKPSRSVYAPHLVPFVRLQLWCGAGDNAQLIFMSKVAATAVQQRAMRHELKWEYGEFVGRVLS